MTKIKDPPYTKAEEADFYRRNAGGPVAMTSPTRGRGFLGANPPQYDWHLMAKRTHEIAMEFEEHYARGGTWASYLEP